APGQVELSLDTYEKLTQPLWKKDQIIIWPEAAVPTTFEYAESYLSNMDRLAIINNAHLILGIPTANPNGAGYYNSIISLGSQKNHYLKRHLVPFGEYIP